MHFYGLNQPAENGIELFNIVRKKYFHYNYEATYHKIFIDFREGKLGNITMDDLSFLDNL